MSDQLDHTQSLANALKQQSIEGVRAALGRGANPNAYLGDYSMLELHYREIDPLDSLERDEAQGIEILKTLLEAGADPNQSLEKGGEGYLLHTVSQHSRLPWMKLLLEQGADPNLRSDDGKTALDWLNGDWDYEVTSNVPDWYKGRVLPEYEMPDHSHDRGRDCWAIWLVSRHQRGFPVLRKAGALNEWEQREVPLHEVLSLVPSAFGGLYTRHGRPEAAFLSALGSALAAMIADWAGRYVDPRTWGRDSAEVRQFDYDAHLAEGKCIGAEVAPHVPEGVTLEIAMASQESIAAGSDYIDRYRWNTSTSQWAHSSRWSDRLPQGWFGDEPQKYASILRTISRG